MSREAGLELHDGLHTFSFDGLGFGIAAGEVREIKMRMTREREGDVVLALSGEGMITISWGPLARAERHWCDLMHFARESQKGLDKAIPQKVRDASSNTASFAGHPAVRTHIRQRDRTGLLLPKRAAETLHFYCEPSGRYFGLLALMPASTLDRCLPVWDTVLDGFHCHR